MGYWIKNLVLQAVYIGGLVQDCSSSISKPLELLQSCTKPSISLVNISAINDVMP